MNKLTKKFVSLLTVVAFLLTLVPAAVFAAGETVAVNGDIYKDATEVSATLTGVTEAGKVQFYKGTNALGAAVAVAKDAKEAKVEGITVEPGDVIKATLFKEDGTTEVAKDDKGQIVSDKTKAEAAKEANEKLLKTSVVVASDKDVLVGEKGKAEVAVRGAYTGDVYVWAEKDGVVTKDATFDQTGDGPAVAPAGEDGFFKFAADQKDSKNYEVGYKFAKTGTYVIHASLVEPKLENGNSGKTTKDTKDAEMENNGVENVKVKVGTAESKVDRVEVKENSKYQNTKKEWLVDPNGVTETPVEVVLYDSNNSKVPVGAGVEAKVSVSNRGLLVDGKAENTYKTNALGQFTIKLTGTLEGPYNVYVEAYGLKGLETATFKALVTPLRAEKLVDVSAPEHPLAYGDYIGEGTLEFVMLDRTGQVIKAPITENSYGLGFNGLLDQIGGRGRKGSLTGPASSAVKEGAHYVYPVRYEGNFINVVKAPSAANLKDSNFNIEYNDGVYSLCVNKVLPVGDYEFEVKLDNGATATFKFSVAKFGKAKELKLEYPSKSIELGGKSDKAKVYFVDENGVQKDAKRYVSLGAVGYAIKGFDSQTGVVRVSNDEKYLGSTIKVTAVATVENLYADATLTVTDGKGGDNTLAFDKKAGVVGENNRVKVSVVDSKGNKVYLGDNYEIKSASAIVTNQSNKDAKIQTNVSELGTKTDGNAILNLMSDKAGSADVLVTLVAQQRYKYTDENNNQAGNDTIFYRGTLHFVFGGNGVNTVVMNIGSLDVIAGDKVVKIDTAPFVKENRTFVPVRALAEAFGAEVKYEDKDKTITITEGGKTVVMTLDSKEYTVNGEKKTLDVAPFVATGNRTVLPIRFAAEALGYTVTPTYSTINGATVSVVFVR